MRPFTGIKTASIRWQVGTRKAAALLTDKGFAVSETGNARKTGHKTTVIEYAEGKADLARKASAVLGTTRADVEPSTSENLGDCDLRITLGTDFGRGGAASRAASGVGGRETS